MKPIFLCIETSTLNCSVAVFKGEELLSSVEESSDAYIHGEKLHVFIQKALNRAKLSPKDLEAVAVTKGPGSYTGLRIGVSAAKGLAFSLGIPMYSLTSLEVLAQSPIEVKDGELILAHVDARRMEIYGAFYSASREVLTDISADVVEEDVYSEIHKGNLVHLIGDAQSKLMDVLPANYKTTPIQFPSAQFMGKAILQKMELGDSEDVAYFEPFYLKDFVAGKPRKSPLDF